MRHVLLALGLCACGVTTSTPLPQTDTQIVTRRTGSVIANGCTLDQLELEALGEPATKAVVRNVVLECLVPHADGTVTPDNPSGSKQLDGLVDQLHTLGYDVALAAAFVTDNGAIFDGMQTAAEISTWSWSDEVATNLAQASHEADELDLDLEMLPASARKDVTHLAFAVAGAVHPQQHTLGIFLPPATTTPSDVPGGDAFDIATLAQFTDRFRVMTLDFSGNTPGSTPGPTIDSGWAVDAVAFALSLTGNAAVDVAMPLYGDDFTTSSTTAPVRLTTFTEAMGLATDNHVTPQRAASQEQYFDYTDPARQTHEVWFDDATSTVVTLGAWDPQTLDPRVGVVFYGLGAEDPTLWTTLAGAMR